MDREKVIKDLEWILEDDRFGFGRNWLKNLDHDQPECEEEWAGLYIEKAIALLKEQDAVEPTWQQGKAYCGSCGKRIPLKIGARFCHKCGRSVKWE